MLDTILVIDSGLGGKDYIEKLKKLHVHDSSDGSNTNVNL